MYVLELSGWHVLELVAMGVEVAAVASDRSFANSMEQKKTHKK